MALVEKAAARAGREISERSVVTMKPSRYHSWTSVGVLKSADGVAQDVGGWTCGRDSERECLLSAIFVGVCRRTCIVRVLSFGKQTSLGGGECQWCWVGLASSDIKCFFENNIEHKLGANINL